MQFKVRTLYAVLFYTLACWLAYLTKPTFLFQKDGSLRRLGMQEGETMFSAVIILSSAAIASYYTFVVIDLVVQ